ncbi:hypothetical protein [Legionella resiliens]|uniref:Uncharacterized protein n=1 Tax=Legionella resiliens TaxID=2905958 RepID=A0ABS8WZ89_9GAMM|nr:MULTISPECIES: hypothetical protein [unclassified Legionella]MCE0721720.1 hypothetical protein [Legionella sp. 9fVS26]MCE3530874.1 hypothetical protein [Legionella sp. 8cVS16]
MQMRSERGEKERKGAKLVEWVTNKILEMINCAQHYRVMRLGSEIVIRESTQNPPIARRKERVELFLAFFHKAAEKGAFELKDAVIKAEIDGKKATIPCIKISNVNIAKFAQVLGLTSGSAKVDQKIWNVIPEEIKLRWNRFNDTMQDHIVHCCTPHADAGLLQTLNTAIFGNSMRSPIGFSVPRIPVRLPNSRLEAGVGNELYDLTEILAIQERHPQRPELRRDPITRDYFSLYEVLPDAAALEKIQQKGMGKS